MRYRDLGCREQRTDDEIEVDLTHLNTTSIPDHNLPQRLIGLGTVLAAEEVELLDTNF